jgi:hypothetical protein
VGDFDGDGSDDLLWHNSSTGMVYIWLMNATSIANEGISATVPDANWRIEGTGDLDGDGKGDIVWHNTATGMVYVWLMDGVSLASEGVAGDPVYLFSIRGVGDFDADGNDDILWRSEFNPIVFFPTVYKWLMDGTSVESTGALGEADDEWEIIL